MLVHSCVVHTGGDGGRIVEACVRLMMGAMSLMQVVIVIQVTWWWSWG